MSFFQMILGEVDNVKSTIGQQQQITSGLMDTIKGYVPKVQAAWIGGDADEFAADVARKLVPAMTELVAAIAGINLNLNKAVAVVNQADKSVQGMADQLGDVFSQI
jgi:uncharacterized protein YukE